MDSGFIRENIPAIASIALLVYVLSVVYRSQKSHLSYLPGPWYTKFTDLLLRYKVVTGQRPRYVHALHEKYGPVVRIGPDEVDVSDISGAREIHRIGSGFLKSPWYSLLNRKDTQSIFTTTDPKYHNAHRRLLSSPMSELSLKSMEPLIDSRVRLTIQKMQEEMKTRGVADVYKWWFFMATDVIGEITFGESFRMLEKGKKNQYVKDIEMTSMIGGIRASFPILVKLATLLPFPIIKEVNESGDRVFGYATESINRYKRLLAENPNNPKPTVFTKLYNAGEEGLPDNEIRDDAQSFIVAGSDTTANTLTYLVWAVCRDPQIKQKLVDELAEIRDDFTDEDLRPLPYLNQVISEALRLYPAVPSALPRSVPPKGTTMGGHWIPGGSTVGTQLYSLHRDPVAYPDPERFEPSRWASPTKLMKDAFMPFGAGSRNCIGLHLAKVELRLATGYFFRYFPNAKVSSKYDFNDNDMEQMLFFLMFPKGKRCLVEV
ncbi:cytochrome P450 [Aspergillus bombycis]|uniref:Cytochrome P450 n=1 Tax=Aspergillus bombycis TaxID=109264 RepID=A0A1F8A4H3_9EURO|nr:cytochrome P450 [Aspergillus bombycis]OGM46593.1 cytochrome P450 [Aspergillus bombycis]